MLKADPAQHDRGPEDAERSPIIRVFLYARPYLALILLLVTLTIGLSSSRYARAYLMKPILDNVLLPQQELVEQGEAPSLLKNIPGFGELSSKVPGTKLAPDSSMAAAERKALGDAVMESLGQIVLAGIALILAMPVLIFCRSYLLVWILDRVYVDIVRDVCAKVLLLPLDFHHSSSRGDVLTRMLADVQSGHGAIKLLLGKLIESAVMIVVGVGVMFYISWHLALVSLAVGPAIFGVVATFNSRIKRSARRRQEKVGDVTGRLIEILAGIKIIKAFQSEADERQVFREETQKLFRRSMKASKNRVLARSLIIMLTNFLTIAMLMLGVMMVLTGRFGVSAGDLAAFGMVLSTTYGPIRRLANSWVLLVDSQASAERFCAILDAPGEPEDPPDAVRINGVHDRVSLRDVSFSYGREPVLDHISFDVEAGQIVALVGRTGAGKTTIADLLMRFYEPSSGSISIDGVDLRRIQRESLLNQIAIVTQEAFLFEGSIRENIGYGRKEASDDEIVAAAVAAHVDEFVDGLPDGYDTEVGVDGVRLSGGQRQRITIARALLKNPAILIFDEATSALDSKSELLVQDAIESLLGGRTVFMIAHRLSTIRGADQIVVIEGGGVSQCGTHQELCKTSGLYRELVDIQTAPDLDLDSDPLPQPEPNPEEEDG
ncbi:MAG: ABC transporter ATP-binding protein [Deltaproteobacteria bacterium]|nr:ABC transporter ATP-binding protein [Deltaproteobacteria bacterium]MBW2400483.1 ABC transporter ATP-binding protein [Deltaproteobacteria bacterium]